MLLCKVWCAVTITIINSIEFIQNRLKVSHFKWGALLGSTGLHRRPHHCWVGYFFAYHSIISTEKKTVPNSVKENPFATSFD